MKNYNDDYFMEQALKEAKKAYAKGEVPIGAVIVMDNKIIARSHNEKETKLDPTLHAEISAIKKACKKLNVKILENATLYVTIEPCLMCCGAIINAHIKRLVYGCREAKFGSVESIMTSLDHTLYPYNNIVEVVSKVKESECKALIQDFFKEIRKKKIAK